jgi:serine protease Do
VTRFTPTLLLSMAAMVAGCADRPAPSKHSAVAAPPVTETSPAAAGPTQPLPDFAALVDRFGKAVVNVEIVGHARATSDGEMSPSSAPLRDFFRRFGIPIPDGQAEEDVPLLRGSGSGFVVSKDGYILTNAHVVAEAEEVTVRLTDRREFAAKVIGSDARTDVALIKIEANDLPTVTIGDHARLRTGEWVLAIGSPFGLENTATAGIVSATSRAVPGGTDVSFIQTDVAVNPGNSGGPLFNLRGEVIGINSMIFSQTGGYMGISFAIPMDTAMRVRDQLQKTGRVVRGRIGVTVQNVDAALARSFGVERASGALVSAVEPRSPAQKAGLQPGDIVLRADQESIDQSNQLSSYIAQRRPGEESTLTVWRAGKEQQIKVQIAELKEPRRERAIPAVMNRSSEGARLGLAVRPLTPQEKKLLDTDGGVVVGTATGAAERAGVQPGDIVIAVNDRPVKSVEDLRAAAKDLSAGEPVALLIEREGSRSYVAFNR